MKDLKDLDVNAGAAAALTRNTTAETSTKEIIKPKKRYNVDHRDGRVNFKIDEQLLEQARTLAILKRITLSELICTLLTDLVKKNKKALDLYEQNVQSIADNVKL